MIVTATTKPLWLARRALPTRMPPEKDGEWALGELLTQFGLVWEYEPFTYPLLNSVGKIIWFQPDFWLPAQAGWPELQPVPGSKEVAA